MGDDDDKLLRLFGDDPDQASDALRHVLRLMVKYFRWRKLPEPEDLAQEVLVRGLTRLARGVIAPDPIRYFYGVAGNVLREDRRLSYKAQALNLDEVMLSLLPVDYRDPAMVILVDEYLALLPPRDADLLVRYHTDDRAALAAELGIGSGALRTRVFRVKETLDRRIRDRSPLVVTECSDGS
jgi:DNA-directed RNA polymerase specialized sigma24 family protein